MITDFDDPEFEFTAIADRQGWSTTSRLDVALSFISSRELGDQLAMFAAGVAAEENSGEDDQDHEGDAERL